MMRWDPFKEIEELQERLAQAMVVPRGQRAESRTFAPLVDVFEDEEGLHFAVYLPGVDPEKVEIVAEDETLTVKAERPFEQKEGVTWHRVEGPYGTFVRSFAVPATFDLSKAKARFKHGVLYLDVPRAEEAKPKKISIEVEQ